MKKHWISLCFVLGFAMLAYNLYFWGGLANTPAVGALVQERAFSSSFLTWIYISAGDSYLNAFGWRVGASEFVTNQVGDLFEIMRASPLTAMDQLFDGLPLISKLPYFGAPSLILLATFAHLRKPKTFKTFGK